MKAEGGDENKNWVGGKNKDLLQIEVIKTITKDGDEEGVMGLGS